MPTLKCHPLSQWLRFHFQQPFRWNTITEKRTTVKVFLPVLLRSITRLWRFGIFYQSIPMKNPVAKQIVGVAN